MDNPSEPVRRRLFHTIALAFLAGAVLSAACSENAGETVGPTEATGSGGSLTLEAKDFSFTPNRLSAQLGQPVTVGLQNSGAARHSIAFYEDTDHKEPVTGGKLDALAPGGSASLTFDPGKEPATLYFRCEVHPDQMRGELAVGSLG